MPHRVIQAMFTTLEAYKRESEALRSILREQGLSNAVIQRKVSSRLKSRKLEETAQQLLMRVCEESLKRFPDLDLEGKFAKLQIQGKSQ
jgi:hypothetical protein